MAKRRLAIYGGSFDPVHLGHVLVACAAREEAKLDEVIFIPAAISPFKQNQVHAPANVRMMMLRLALAGFPWCVVSDLEVNRDGVSYSVDTVRAIADKHPGASLFLIIGADNLKGLSAWREIDTLKKLVEFLVVPRPDVETPSIPSGFRWQLLRGWPMAVSSSEIRARVADGLPVSHLVPNGVADIIHNNRLYLR